MTRSIFLLVLLCIVTSGCATRTAPKPDARDPFERINRATFKFNDTLDHAAFKPIAKGYRKVTPRFVQTGVANFMDNLDGPRVLVNDLLQGKFKATLNDTGRLLLNTTLGLGGLLDPATDAGLDKNDEDFGQTFGKWGIRGGPYIMLPFFGPSTLRDSVSMVPDHFADPITYIERDSVHWSVYGVSKIDTRARLLDVEESLNQAYDRYALLRTAYLQRREYQVKDGDVPEEPVDEEEIPDGQE